jgi:phosphate transport system permease protein
LTAEYAIKTFFGSNAVVAIVVLALITIFLFREGFGFFGQNLTNLRLYRRAGLEYVDILRAQAQAHSALSRQLNEIQMQETAAKASETARQNFDRFAIAFSEAGDELNGLVSDTNDQAVALRDSLLPSATKADTSASSIDKDRFAENPAKLPRSDLAQGMVALRSTGAKFEQIADAMKAKIDNLLAAPPQLSTIKARQLFEKWRTKARAYLAQLPATSEQLRAWDAHKPVPAYRAVTSFLFGSEWITASFWQDWYGIIPLLVGSIMVAVVALLLAVPFGISAAIYVSEVAQRSEKSLIKPYIEFISAIPSVVLGFFGIAVVGQAIRALSQSSLARWVPCSLSWPSRLYLRSRKTPCRMCRADSRKLLMRSVPIAYKPSRECSCPLRSRGLYPLFCLASVASLARPWWCCFAPVIALRFPTSPKVSGLFFNRCTP